MSFSKAKGILDAKLDEEVQFDFPGRAGGLEESKERTRNGTHVMHGDRG